MIPESSKPGTNPIILFELSHDMISSSEINNEAYFISRDRLILEKSTSSPYPERLKPEWADSANQTGY